MQHILLLRAIGTWHKVAFLKQDNLIFLITLRTSNQ